MPQDDTLANRYQETGELQLPTPGAAAPPSLAQEAMQQAVDDNTPTPASAWQSSRKQGFVVTLPSGNKIRIRRTFDVIEMMKEDGTVTNPLLGIVIQNINEGKETNTEDLSPEQQAEMYAWILEVCCKAAVEPRVVIPPEDAKYDWEPPEGCISVGDLTLEDQMFIWNVAQGGTANLARFREEAQDVLGPLQQIEAVGDSA